MRAGTIIKLGVAVLLALAIAPQLMLTAIGTVIVLGLAAWVLIAWAKARLQRGRGWGQ